MTVEGSRGESPAHRTLKRLAVAWARAHRLRLTAEEVRLPRSGYRADVAAATPRVLSESGRTAVFECKVSRSDLLADSARECGASEQIRELNDRLVTLRRLIGGHRPDLRRHEELFADFDAIDLRGLRHETHDRLTTELRTAQNKLQAGTKFARLARWRAASLLYLVVEPELVEAHEVPEGWGLLERRGDELMAITPPCLNETSPMERVALLERIAAAAGRTVNARERAEEVVT